MKNSLKNNLFLLFIFVMATNPTDLFGGPMYPLKKSAAATMASKPGDPPLNMLTIYGGTLAGGKQNTCYVVKSKLILMNKINLEGSFFYNINHDQLYSALFGYGNVITFCAGMEWGDRPFFVPKDSTYQKIQFKNLATGQDVPYSDFIGYSFPQKINSYTLGISFNAKFPSTNFWRGKGNCWTLLNFKWEAMYAPKIGYSTTFDKTIEGPYQSTTETYALENAAVRHWGFRLVIDTRMSSKLGFMMETGLRPGIKYEINDKGTFSGGYLRMGVAIGLTVGGRKALKAQLEE